MKSTVSILCTGLNKTELESARACVSHLTIHERPCDADQLMENVVDPAPAFIFCGTETGDLPPNEVAQLLRSVYQDAQIHFLSSQRETFKRDLLVKNGFNDAYLVPIENGILKDAVTLRLAEMNAGPAKSYRSVSLIDIAPDTTLTFDVFVYLPMNGKHVRFSGANEAISKERSDRLRKHQMQSVHVKTDQMPAFYKFTADQLKKLDGTPMSDTERKERKQKAVRELLSQMFSTDSATDFSKGQELVKDCNEIIKSYVVGEDGKNSWYEKIMSHSGEAGGSYSHSTNVATFAALFSLGLGIGKPEELAMAGLLHDIGLADLPPDIQQKKEDELTPEERMVYQQHPEYSVNMIKSRRLVVSEKVVRAISEHHERFSGDGYPKQLPGDRICLEAQVLGMADVFADLMQLESGRARVTPMQAVKQMIDECAGNPSHAQFDLSLLRRLANLFPSSLQQAEELTA